MTSLETMIGRSIGQFSSPLSRSDIESYQAERLCSLIDFCRERSSFYRRSFTDAGVTTIKGLENLTDLPLTCEDDLRAYGSQMVCVSQDEVARIITLQSSGTTGNPKRLHFTDADLERTLDFFHHGMLSLVDPGQTVAILLPGAAPDSTGHMLAQALKRMKVSAAILGLVDDPTLAARTLYELQPDVLVGFPVQLLAIARMAASLKLQLGPIRSVLLCSDYIPESLGTQLAKSLESQPCEVFSHYGTVETGLGGGVDCEAHCGMHLREADLLFEIIDPKTTNPLAIGRWGEIVVTTITRNGMPLIRYRTGDRGRLLPGPCPCGSHIRRLDRVFGRINQVRTLGNGNGNGNGNQLSLQTLDELLFPLSGLLDFRAVLTTGRGRETLHLCLVTLPGNEDDLLRQVSQRMATILTKLKLELVLTIDSTTTIHPGKRILEIKREEIRQ
jgi:phenylacetate-coenzyme A ligase PaaK-like adenylate-forming protein